MPAAPPAPSVEEVGRIVALGDRVLRNLAITQCYADLSAAMRARCPGVNWCTFALWASRQAGTTIRGEDLLDRFRRRLGRHATLLAPWESLSRWLLRKGVFNATTRLGRVAAEIHTPFDAFERASEGVAAGNLKVFAEIGKEFARFMATVPPDAPPDSEEMRSFTRALAPGPPPDGQELLAGAFMHFQQQRLEHDPAARAALLLLANLKIGLHEQTRLQPEIAAAMDAPLVTAADLGARILAVLIPGSRRWPRLLRAPVATPIGWLANTVRGVSVKIAREAVTEAMMVLRLPDRVLDLGRDLDVPVPPLLANNPDAALNAFVKPLDPCAPGGIACAARDWCDFPQRMHYILHFFRAYAVDSRLFESPFTTEQAAAIRRGVIPDGVL
jgi:hypothetical protein